MKIERKKKHFKKIFKVLIKIKIKQKSKINNIIFLFNIIHFFKH